MQKDRKLGFQEIEELRKPHKRTTNKHSIWLHDIRSAYNIGSAFRTCDASGAERLYLSGYSPHPPREDISKTALGADKDVKFTYLKDPNDIIQSVKSNNNTLIAVELTENATPYTELDHSDLNSTFLFGNEVSGIPEDLINQCNKSVIIPMHGRKHSLNVSVTVGIISYWMEKIARETSK